MQERYVELFDRTRSLSLHLFEHVHGESRDRGQAMIDLKSLYEKNGLFLGAAELPDYVPVFLEFLSTRPLTEARTLLGQTAHILTALAERLEKRRSPYAAVFALSLRSPCRRRTRRLSRWCRRAEIPTPMISPRSMRNGKRRR